MTHSNNAKKNKQQKHSKKLFEQYLYNARAPWDHVPDEPSDYVSSDTLAELEAELLESIIIMRRRFKHNVQRLKNQYS